MRGTRRVVAAALFAAGAALALAADPPAKDAVEVRLAGAKGTTVRFRRVSAAVTEVDGALSQSEDATYEYSIAPAGPRADGGVDADVTIDRIRRKAARPTGGSDFDSAEGPVGDAPRTLAQAALAKAMCGRPFRVVFDARGVATSASGLREAVAEGLKGTAHAALPVDRILTDDDVMRLVGALFPPAPAGAHAVGATWTADGRHEVGSTWLDFREEWTLAGAGADEAAYETKLAWKPGAEATADGATAAGGGEGTSRYSRRDGLVVAWKMRLEVRRAADGLDAKARHETTVERLPAAGAKAPDVPGAKPGGAPRRSGG